MIIDWDEAPEGATHYHNKLGTHWLKESPASYWFGKEWVRYHNTSKGQRDIAAAVPKPPS